MQKREKNVRMYEIVLYNIQTENINCQIRDKIYIFDHLFMFALLPVIDDTFSLLFWRHDSKN